MRSHIEKNLLSRQHARPALIQGHLKFFGSRVLLYFAEPAATLLGSATVSDGLPHSRRILLEQGDRPFNVLCVCVELVCETRVGRNR